MQDNAGERRERLTRCIERDLALKLDVDGLRMTAVDGHTHRCGSDAQRIIANPNCSTIIMVMGLKPLYDIAKIRRIVVSTYQAVSGAGKDAEANILPVGKLPKHYQIAFNLIPQIEVFMDNLYTKEEMKMIDETKKIMEDDSLRITATTVRVPVYRSHAESVNVEFESEVSLDAARKALAAFPGVILRDNPSEQEYPMPLFTSGKTDVEIGRLRRDESTDNALNFWICGDQIRKGAALNALQIAEYMIAHELI